jgi:D-alanine-D-alanine ligase
MAKKRPKRRDITQVLGPVESLEYYVKADWWKEIFNANYLRTDGDVVDDINITKTEIDLFVSVLELTEQSCILDLCCGQGRHSLELARRGFRNIYGLDRSHYLINRARKQNRQEGLNVNFREGDARKLPYQADMFDIVLIPGNSFGYFETFEDDHKVLREVLRTLKPGGKVLLDITDGNFIKGNYDARSWEWIDKNYFVCRERSLSQDQDRLISREVITHTKKGVIADQFYAERLYTPEGISDLLKCCGFSEMKFNSEVTPNSQRNQDLGMMARRMLITATAIKPWTPRKTRAVDQKSVTVLMGDPRIRDIVKPNATFDEDDIQTIDELKNALAQLPDYRFTYFDNHREMLSHLAGRKGKTDFIMNLCDEGFYNDPAKELHVPALLEMMELPYTGGNPQCLAFCYDKSLVRGIAKEIDLPVPEAFVIKPEDSAFIEFPLQFPVIVKPNIGDASFGINKDSVCSDIPQLQQAILRLRGMIGYEKNILIEEFLTGSDISVGIIGNLPDNYTVLPIIEEDYSSLPEDLPRVCGYEAKWDPDSPYWNIKSIPADLPEDTYRFIVASCLRLFNRLNIRDYARFDWRLDSNGTPRLLEVNPNPGWCWDGHLAKMSKLAGITYPEMLGKILKAAELRIFGDYSYTGNGNSH